LNTGSFGTTSNGSKSTTKHTEPPRGEGGERDDKTIKSDE